MKRGRVVFFITGNVHKFHEARHVLSKFDIATAMLNIDAVEIQHDDIKEIAKTSALDAAHRCGFPVFVEDAGLFVIALKGFPGPYSSYIYRTIGTNGILKLMKTTEQRHAYFRSVVAFCDPSEKSEPLCFEGRVDGRITDKEKGENGFGFDPIFAPETEPEKTFAQMTTGKKNQLSHRSQALRKFTDWYVTNFRPKSLRRNVG